MAGNLYIKVGPNMHAQHFSRGGRFPEVVGIGSQSVVNHGGRRSCFLQVGCICGLVYKILIFSRLLPMEDFSDTGFFVHSSIASGLVGFISILAMVLVVCCRISYLLYIRTESQKDHVFPSLVSIVCPFMIFLRQLVCTGF